MGCRGVALAALVLLCAAGELSAQAAVSLRLRPRLGDTLYMRIEQQMEMRGRPHNSVDEERVLTNTLRVRARAIPTRMSGAATIITTITDSLVSDSPLGMAQLEPARRSVLGRAVEVRVLPDGAMEVLSRAEHEDDVSPLLGQMPAVLPAVSVRPGDQWVREMRLPIRGSRGTPASVRATFRLDSLGRGGQVAYISVRGAFYERTAAGATDRPAPEGSLTGLIEFDRDLGWISDMRTTIITRSEVRLPDPRVAPMAVWMRITQRLQARTTP